MGGKFRLKIPNPRTRSYDNHLIRRMYLYEALIRSQIQLIRFRQRGVSKWMRRHVPNRTTLPHGVLQKVQRIDAQLHQAIPRQRDLCSTQLF